MARFSLAKAGSYRLGAQQNFSGSNGPQVAQASLDLQVGASSGTVALRDVRFETQPRPSGTTTSTCISAVVFDFAVDVATAGNYACNVAPVSYTHLDVYKRQTPSISKPLFTALSCTEVTGT